MTPTTTPYNTTHTSRVRSFCTHFIYFVAISFTCVIYGCFTCTRLPRLCTRRESYYESYLWSLRRDMSHYLSLGGFQGQTHSHLLFFLLRDGEGPLYIKRGNPPHLVRNKRLFTVTLAPSNTEQKLSPNNRNTLASALPIVATL